jgi:hypothetical protein
MREIDLLRSQGPLRYVAGLIFMAIGAAISWLSSRPCAIGLHRWGPIQSLMDGHHIRHCKRCFEKQWLG